MVEYRVVEIPTSKSNSSNNTSPTIVNGNVIAQLQPQFFVINDPSLGNVIVTGANSSIPGATPIAPKQPNSGTLGAASSASGVTAANARSSCAPVAKKRDERRRATHNEVERRRRDKINHWIMN